MKISQKKRSKKPLILSLLAGILIVIAAAYILIAKPFSPSAHSEVAPTNTVNYGPATDQEKQDSTSAKQNAVNSQEPQPQQNSSISVTITRTTNGSGATPVSIRTLINGAKTGTCDVTFTKNGQPDLIKTFTIIYQATSSSCNGDVPTSEFSSGGEWQTSVVAHVDNTISAAATTVVTVTR